MKLEFSMLCPVCQCTGPVTIECESPDLKLRIKPAAKCAKCGSDMYQADVELIPTLQILNARGICTLYHCSNAHEGSDAFRKDLDDKRKMYGGAYIIMQDLNNDLMGMLTKATIDYNSAEHDMLFDFVVEISSRTSLFESFDKHSRATLQIYTHDNALTTMRKAVVEFHSLISNTLELYETLHGPYVGFSKEQMSNIKNGTELYLYDEADDYIVHDVPYMVQVPIRTDI